MDSFSQNAILRRVSDLRLHVDSSNHVEVGYEGRVISCGSYGLKVLDAFSRPNSIANVIATLAPQLKGTQDWMDLTATIV